MARLAWVTMTRGREAGSNRRSIEPRVDAGVKELTEMTYRSNRRSGEPVATSGSRSRSTVRDRTANPIWAGGYGAALQKLWGDRRGGGTIAAMINPDGVSDASAKRHEQIPRPVRARNHFGGHH